MKPWFRGFKGRVFEQDDTWITEGVWKVISRTIKVSELPPGRWTQDYKEYLDTLVEKKVIGNYTNNSTTEDVDFVIQEYTGKDIIKDLKSKDCSYDEHAPISPNEGYPQIPKPGIDSIRFY